MTELRKLLRHPRPYLRSSCFVVDRNENDRLLVSGYSEKRRDTRHWFRSRADVKQVLGTLTVRVLLVAAGFASSIVTARMLGPDGRGLFFYWSTLAALAIQFGNLGLHSSNIYYLAKGEAQLSTLGANTIWISLIGGTVLAIFLLFVLWSSGRSLGDNWPLLWPTLLMIPFGLYFLLANSIFIAVQRFVEYNRFELLNRYGALGAITVTAWLYKTPESLLAALALVSAVVCFPLYRRIRVLGGKGTPSLVTLRHGLGYGLRAYLVALVALMVLRLNAVLLERYVDAESLGIWSIAVQLLDVIAIIPASFALVLFPKLIDSNESFALIRWYLAIVATILAVICLVVAVTGRELILFVYGEAFAGAYEMVLLGLPAAVSLGLISVLAQFLAAAGIPRQLLWIWCAGLLLELAIAAILIPKYGALGAMAALSTTYLSILALIWLLVGQVRNSRFHEVSGHAR